MFWRTRREETMPAGFERTKLLLAREKTRNCLRRIAESIHPGMTEGEALSIADTVLTEAGAEKNWHRPCIRFGVNTTLPFGVSSQDGVVLGSDDIFFVDIGPVFDGYEGDAGDTFTTGSSPHLRRCKTDVRRIFSDVRRHWKSGHAKGRGLYEHAQQRAKERGWLLNLSVDGHRLSEFPHHVLFRGGLSGIEYAPAADAWVLEIQIRHPSTPFGAFFEDLLTD